MIEFDLDLPIAPIRARVFETDFSRAFSNLLENSIDAIASRGVIHVKCKVNSDTQEIIILVRDNGQGIPPEILGNVGRYGFTFGKSEGSGLGLAFAINVAKSVGGTVVIESEQNKHTTITMSLPLGHKFDDSELSSSKP